MRAELSDDEILDWFRSSGITAMEALRIVWRTNAGVEREMRAQDQMEIDLLLMRMDAVRELHRPDFFHGDGARFCIECTNPSQVTSWPCATVKMLGVSVGSEQ